MARLVTQRRAFECLGERLDETVVALTADAWYIRQIYQETTPMRVIYRIFCQREVKVPEIGSKYKKFEREELGPTDPHDR